MEAHHAETVGHALTTVDSEELSEVLWTSGLPAILALAVATLVIHAPFGLASRVDRLACLVAKGYLRLERMGLFARCCPAPSAGTATGASEPKNEAEPDEKADLEPEAQTEPRTKAEPEAEPNIAAPAPALPPGPPPVSRRRLCTRGCGIATSTAIVGAVLVGAPLVLNFWCAQPGWRRYSSHPLPDQICTARPGLQLLQ
eukprot:SAG11_NODE_68_length_18649_cov_29.058005_18_plen_200_part_00